MTNEYATLSAAWERRCIGVETLQSLPLAALLLVPLCELPELPPRSGDVIGDMLRAAVAIVARWRAELARGGDVAAWELDEMKLRLDVLRELRRREKDGAS
jgi:hypothetical protein